MTSGRDNLVPAFVLHTRAFRDTSLIVDLLTPTSGLISVVAKGARSGKHKRALLLQAFRPLHVGWIGRGELPTLTSAEEVAGSGPVATDALRGTALACGYYLNELALHLLPRQEPAPHLFACYWPTLANLVDPDQRDQALRCYEMTLLWQIGYAPVLNRDIDSGATIEPQHFYHYRIPDGPVLATASQHSHRFSGRTLLDLQALDFSHRDTLREARDLTRRLIHHHLDGRELQSRKMFRLYDSAGRVGNG